MIVGDKPVCLPRFGEGGRPVRQLPAVSRRVVFAVHVVDHIRRAACFEGTQHVAVAYVAGRQRIVPAAYIGDQVIEHLLPVFRSGQSHIEGDGVCRLAVAIVLAGGRVPESPVEGLFDPGGQLAVLAGILRFA